MWRLRCRMQKQLGQGAMDRKYFTSSTERDRDSEGHPGMVNGHDLLRGIIYHAENAISLLEGAISTFLPQEIDRLQSQCDLLCILELIVAKQQPGKDM